MRRLFLVIFAVLATLAPALAQSAPPDLTIRYLPGDSFTAASRSASAAIQARKDRKSVRYFTAGADLAVTAETPSIDFGPGIGVAKLTRVFRRAPGDFTWVGAVAGDGRALLVVRDGALTGSVSTASGNHEILPLGNRLHALVALDAAKTPAEHSSRPLPRAPGRRVIDKDAAARLRAGEAATVDIFVGYSTAAKTEYAGDMPAYIQSAVDDANLAYTDSGIDLQLRLVGTLEVAHGGNLDTALDDLTNSTNGLGPIRTAAAAANADMTSFMAQSGGFCGVAYLFASEANWALSVTAWDCAVGNHSFAHELGHNFGARHDPYVDSATSPYAYGHGYINLPGRWRTILAYNNECSDNGFGCTRIGRFSTPLKTYNGVATGTSATHDNARIHNEVAATVAAFRNGSSFSLTVTRSGSGTVTSSPAGISCGASCVASFASGTNVTLTATADANATFVGWSGACTGSAATCSVAMTAARAVTATFQPVSRTLTVSRLGSGGGSVTSSPAGISCGATCSAGFDHGTSVTLTAAPDGNSTFAGWSGACTGTGTCTVSMTAAQTVSATFNAVARTLTVAKTGTGDGSVTSSPAGIACGATCSANFSSGTSVTLTATPDADSSFAGWAGACTGTGTCTVSMTAARSVTATFTAAPRALTVTKTGSGDGSVTSSPAGIACGATCSATFSNGTSVTLTATPDADSTFTGWSGACTGTGTCTVSMTAARSVTATFTVVQRALTVATAGTGTGTVTSSPAGISCGATCSANFAGGTTVTLTAAADGDSDFGGWSGACSGTGTCTVTMSAARSVTATFTAKPRSLSVARAGSGGGSVASSPAGVACGPTCSANFAYGTSVVLTATADEDSTFAGWTGACSGTGSCTVTMTAPRSVTATFTLRQRPLSVVKLGSGAGTVTSAPAGIACGTTCGADFVNGTSVTLTAVPASGSSFAGWSGACTGTASTCTVTMTAARSVSATFTRNTANLTVARSGAGTGSVTSSPAGISCGATCVAPFPVGTSVTLTATPAANSVFSGWTGACAGFARTCTVAMSAAKSTTAVFTPARVTLTVTRSGSGTVVSSPAGIACGSTCSAQFAGNAVVTLTATPASNSAFMGWTGACTGAARTCSVTLNAAKTVNAVFAPKQTLTVSKSGTGTVNSTPAGIACGNVCSAGFTPNSAVTLRAVPASGFRFGGWSGNCSGASTVCTVTMGGTRAVRALFIRI